MSAPLSFLTPLRLPRSSTFTRFLRISNRHTRFASTSSLLPPSNQPSKPSKLSNPSTTTSISTSPRPYWLTKTGTSNIPVYQLSKRGGNLHQTRVRRIEGDIVALRTDLQRALELEDKEIVINQLTQQIIIKGHKRMQVVKFIEDNKIAEER